MDLQTACRLDYDDDANEMLKEVLPNVSFHNYLLRKKKHFWKNREIVYLLFTNVFIT